MRYRQIHLDFHTSEHIPDVGREFEAQDFVATLQAAHVDSVTVFAKCHHGWCYYPTAIGQPHPHLARPDLLGEMVTALRAADMDAPIYLTVQWDELTARTHPEWRVLAADNCYHNGLPGDASAAQQLSPAWHTLCLNHAALRQHILDQAREIAARYAPSRLFFDFVGNHGCVCPACIETMLAAGLDPAQAADRLTNDTGVNRRFRHQIATALRQEFPGVGHFFNFGHVSKVDPTAFEDYSHLELESLPTGGWGYDHFPASARYAATLGLDHVAHTGKFHTSWGEFGGFKHPDALAYECAQMLALGSKCLVGDQLHPSGAINADTYHGIAPAFARVKALEPFVQGARQVVEIAILSAEHMNPGSFRNHPSDDGAAQMLLELHQGFDIIDTLARFEDYRVILLPDEIPLCAALAARLEAYVAAGGALIASGRSGLGAKGFALDFGLVHGGEVAFNPSCMQAAPGLDPALVASPFVCYHRAQQVTAASAEILAEIVPPYFNRSYRHFSSHQHTPDAVGATTLGAAVTLNGRMAYVAYPIFAMYGGVGQPLYRHVIRGLLRRLLPGPALTTSLPTGGRASLTRQSGRHVLHLLYGTPQVRGKALPTPSGTRIIEMIEDIPTLGPVSARLHLPGVPRRAWDAMTGEAVALADLGDGRVQVDVPSLHIHRAIVLEDLRRAAGQIFSKKFGFTPPPIRPLSGRRSAASAGPRPPAPIGHSCRSCRCRGPVADRCRWRGSVSALWPRRRSGLRP